MDLEITHRKSRYQRPPLEELQRLCSLSYSIPLVSIQQSLVFPGLWTRYSVLCLPSPMALFYVCVPMIRLSTNLLTSAETQFPNKVLGECEFVGDTIQPTMSSIVIIYLIPPINLRCKYFFKLILVYRQKTKAQQGKSVPNPNRFMKPYWNHGFPDTKIFFIFKGFFLLMDSRVYS